VARAAAVRSAQVLVVDEELVQVREGAHPAVEHRRCVGPELPEELTESKALLCIEQRITHRTHTVLAALIPVDEVWSHLSGGACEGGWYPRRRSEELF
jgi:hypothetical protein